MTNSPQPAAPQLEGQLVRLIQLDESVLEPYLEMLADPEILGVDRLADLQAKGDDAPALIFAPNHHSHVDTPTLLTSIPERWRKKLVVGAAADYFFGTRVTSALSAFVIGAIGVEGHSSAEGHPHDDALNTACAQAGIDRIIGRLN